MNTPTERKAVLNDVVDAIVEVASQLQPGTKVTTVLRFGHQDLVTITVEKTK